ncbi:uncharacterized protein MKK02DRAFT_35587 [Dioszegia hungarica]|uniref:Uncharacterized protein n=1 Tax=Dioszegia hungarica TaxID=4972 RepID=A0AA38H134_9TREE|nr:uncharacterized protein MKK02DRAFT_35587 [Dioszegia hungarica]KAI9631761.1 hypothetical protein MKK02DRAFT_35587 [Dioszegia hungarica]
MPGLPLSGPTPSPASSPQHPIPTLGGHSKTPSQIYVLSADGSHLFLLDPTEPPGELPPAYHTIQSPRSAHTSAASLPPTSPRYSYSHSAEIGVEDEPNGGPSSPRSVRVQALPSVRSRSSASLGAQGDREEAGGRHRAYTTSEAGVVRGRGALQDGRISLGGSAQMRAANSGIEPDVDADERTALLGGLSVSGRRRRSTLRSVFCGELEDEYVDMTWKAGWRRFWTPIGRKEYWRSLLHLVLLNFPFALLIWPFLFAGTVAGTALLITLPIGAAVWWLTLILARTAARVEIMMQTHHHAPLSRAIPVYHPIFHRPLYACTQYVSDGPTGEEQGPLEWERGFIKCSYAMFCDHYSYSALCYFVLIKPLLTLFPTIAIIALLPIAFVSGFGSPVYLRAARRWGRWQAGVALDNL